ncbi:vacuolar protein sorting-associated protein 45 [Marasmius sp. AFHP31]|nr:vacuolar protein sorting-associated protein 45 [Marasmius sp. AFHP31]
MSHNILKRRIDSTGFPILVSDSYTTDLRNELDKKGIDPDYCGSCYGGLPSGKSGCCNTCEEVRMSYVNRGWSFSDPDAIEQCKNEGWAETLRDQANEGCNIAGPIRVNKVIGNIHFSPGRSFLTATGRNLVPYVRDDGNRHDFSHTIHRFSFEGDDEYDLSKAIAGREMKRRLAQAEGEIENPLDNATGQTSKAAYMFQYFLKVVSTQFRTIDGQIVNTHQYSVTQFERDLNEVEVEQERNGVSNVPGMSHIAYRLLRSHPNQPNPATPGAFFNFEISPILVVHSDMRQSFAHFITSTCAIVGGVLTVASLVDSVLFVTTKVLKKSRSVGANGDTNGHGGY